MRFRLMHYAWLRHLYLKATKSAPVWPLWFRRVMSVRANHRAIRPADRPGALKSHPLYSMIINSNLGRSIDL